MHITSNPPREVDWKQIQARFIIIHDLHKVMPTMRYLACSLAWFVMACGTCYIAIFCSALAAMLGKKEPFFLMVEKRGTAR